MDPQAGGSFIPKKSLTEGTRPGGGMGVALVAALFVFVLSALAAGGVFAYATYLEGSIASMDESLKKAEGAFDAASIQTLIRFDQRITETKKLLGSHISASGIFAFLSAATLEKVQLASLEYAHEQGDVTLSLQGSADSFSTVALQSDELSRSQVLRDVVFSGIVIEQGRVAFAVNAKVDPALVLYRKYVTAGAPQASPAGQQASPAQQQQPQPAPPATTTPQTQ